MNRRGFVPQHDWLVPVAISALVIGILMPAVGLWNLIGVIACFVAAGIFLRYIVIASIRHFSRHNQISSDSTTLGPPAEKNDTE